MKFIYATGENITIFNLLNEIVRLVVNYPLVELESGHCAAHYPIVENTSGADVPTRTRRYH